MLIFDVGITKFKNKFILFEIRSDNNIDRKNDVYHEIHECDGLAP